METARLGRTEAVVSRLGFGGAPAGLTNYLGEYSPTDPRQRNAVIAAIRRAVELGVAYFDTAPAYGDGASETIFGDALQGEPVFLATKVGSNPTDIRRSVEASLKRLRRERLDLVQFHGGSFSSAAADAILSDGGALEQLERLRDEGATRFIGFSSEDTNPAVYRFIESGRFDTMQIAYNLLYQHPAEPTRPFGSIVEATERDMGVVTMRTLTSGIFQKWVQTVNPANAFDY
ncbi:MAG: aldo/keto reductase, partial [Candidatus Poribacteria bacterium]|nr:aldo/keto reductase [Candidatus Poribacteria bacterium]